MKLTIGISYEKVREVYEKENIGRIKQRLFIILKSFKIKSSYKIAEITDTSHTKVQRWINRFNKYDWLRGVGTPIDFDGAQGQPKYSSGVEVKNSSPELINLELKQNSSRSIKVHSVYTDPDNDNATIDPTTVQWFYSQDGQTYTPIPCQANPLELILDQNGIYMVSAQSKDSEGAMSDRKEATFNTANINTAVRKEQWELYK